MQYCPLCHSPALDIALTCPTCGAPLETPGEALIPGTLLRSGAYRIEKVLGQGGYGITYLAQDTGLSSPVALKELFPEGTVLRGSGGTVRPTHTGRLSDFESDKKAAFREAQILYALRDPSIVQVLSVWEENNTVYLAMEYLEGETLGERLESGPLTEVQALPLLRRLLEGLGKVHTQGVLHRDLKPDNLMLSARYGPVLIDFGNARSYSAQASSIQTKLIATPAYAAPEQFSSSATLGPATDLYGLAATFYHALSGIPPVQAPERLLGTPLPPLSDLRPDLSAQLLALLEQTLSLAVAQRPQSAGAWLSLLPSSSAVSPAPTINVSGTPSRTPSSVSTVQVSPVSGGHRPARARSRGPLGLLLSLGTLGIVGVGVALVMGNRSSSPTVKPSVARSSQPAPVKQNSPSSTALGQARVKPPVKPLAKPPVKSPNPVSRVAALAPVQAAPPRRPVPVQAAPTLPSSGSVISSIPSFAPSRVEIAVGRLNVRSQPSLQATALSLSGQPLQLALGQVAQVGQTKAGWTEVNVGGQLGWVSTRLTVPLEPQVQGRAMDALVQATRQGGRLILERGVYRLPAGLSVSAPLELVGQGIDQTYLISDAASPTLESSVNLNLSGLTVAHYGPAPTAVLRVNSGALKMNGVRVMGGRDDAQNRPEDGDAGDGLVVAGDARAEVFSSELIANAWRGLHTLGRSNVMARDSRFESNSGSGALFEADSSGQVRTSRAFLNDLAGFKVVDRATLALSGSTLIRNGNGVYLSDSATVTLSRNSCSNNSAGDVYWLSGTLLGDGVCSVVRPHADPAPVAAAPPASMPSSISELVKVENPALNYALQVPGGWVRSSISAATQKDTWSHPTDARIKVLVEVNPSYGGDPLAGWQALDTQLRAKYGPRYRVLDLSERASGALGQTARWEFLLEKGGDTLHKVDLAAGRYGRGYAVLVQAPDNVWVRYGPQLEAALESFTFLQ